MTPPQLRFAVFPNRKQPSMSSTSIPVFKSLTNKWSEIWVMYLWNHTQTHTHDLLPFMSVANMKGKRWANLDSVIIWLSRECHVWPEGSTRDQTTSQGFRSIDCPILTQLFCGWKKLWRYFSPFCSRWFILFAETGNICVLSITFNMYKKE